MKKLFTIAAAFFVATAAICQTHNPQCPAGTIVYRTTRDGYGQLHDVACLDALTGKIEVFNVNFTDGTSMSTAATPGANTSLSNLNNPTAINLSTLLFSGAAGLTAQGSNEPVTLTPSGSANVIIGANGLQFPDLSVETTAKRVIAIPFLIDGGGSVISTGVKGMVSVPFNCTLTGWVVVGDQSGSIDISVSRASFASSLTFSSISGTDDPTLSSVQAADNLGPLSNWTSTAINLNDVLEFDVNSASTVTRVTVTLYATVP